MGAKYDYPIHPDAEVFPMMDADTFKEFKADIDENGCKDPIILWKGMVIDGRNRLKACKELQIQPPIMALPTDEDPHKYMNSANYHRRNLTPSQRAVAAVDLANRRVAANPPRGGEIPQATKEVKASTRTVERVQKVVREGSKDLVQAVRDGELKVNEAVRLANKVPDKQEQSRLLRRGSEAVRAALKKRPKPAPSQSSGLEDAVQAPAKPAPKLPARSKLLDRYHEFMDPMWEEATQGEQFAMRADLNSRETK